MRERPLYLLDTNVCIVYLQGRSTALQCRFDAIDAHLLAMCSVVKAELFYGAKRSNNPTKALNEQRLFLNLIQIQKWSFDMWLTSPPAAPLLSKERFKKILVPLLTKERLGEVFPTMQNYSFQLGRGLDQFVSFPFDDACADIYGDIRANLAGLGTPIGANDLLIAAIALTNQLTLVTHNIREFSRVPELPVEDWEYD